MFKVAFNFMKYDIAKMVGVLSGILISVFLIGEQLGIFNAMMTNVRGLTAKYPNYVWVVNEKTTNIMQTQVIDTRVGRMIQSIEGVEKVHPVVFSTSSAQFSKGTKLTASLIGVSAPEYFGGAQKFTPETNVADLATEGAMIVSKNGISTMENIKIGDYFTINDQRVFCSGYMEGVSGFGTQFMMTTVERARKLSNMKPNEVSAFLIKVDSTKTTNEKVIAAINSQIPAAKALQGQVFGDQTLSFMLKTSNIAMSFGMMVAFAIIAGFTIVGLTMFSSVKDRMRDYGTLKAMGGDNSLIRKLIMIQAGLYGSIGFTISYALLMLSQQAMKGGEMEVVFPMWLNIFLVVITLCISMVSSLIAMRKIIKLEPVEIFRM